MLDNCVYVDVETTGLDPKVDKICQIAVITKDKEISETLNPGVLISKEAQDIHGISNTDVKDCKTFKEVASKIYKLVTSSKVFVAFNSNFDFSFLKVALKEHGYNLNYSDFIIIDPLKIHRHYHKNNLQSLYKFYTGSDMDNAHNALYDIKATAEMLDSQIVKFPEILDMVSGEKKLDSNEIFSNWFNIKDKIVTFKKGKHKGKRVKKVVREDPDYLLWMNDKVDNLSIEENKILDKLISLIQ